MVANVAEKAETHRKMRRGDGGMGEVGAEAAAGDQAGSGTQGVELAKQKWTQPAARETPNGLSENEHKMGNRRGDEPEARGDCSRRESRRCETSGVAIRGGRGRNSRRPRARSGSAARRCTNNPPSASERRGRRLRNRNRTTVRTRRRARARRRGKTRSNRSRRRRGPQVDPPSARPVGRGRACSASRRARSCRPPNRHVRDHYGPAREGRPSRRWNQRTERARLRPNRRSLRRRYSKAG